MLDLGMGGAQTYERWSRRFGCPAGPLEAIRLEEVLAVRALFAAGIGCLRDRQGLDWWELTVIRLHQQMEVLKRVRRFAATVGPGDRIFVTRAGFYADALALMLKNSPHCFPPSFLSPEHGPVRFVRNLSRLSWAQVVEIFWDKYDGSYSIRSSLSQRHASSRNPVVLLPSAYGNVSRLGAAYAKTLPGEEFLLVSTRRSGWLAAPPANVAVASLAGYATTKVETQVEYAELLRRWQDLRRDLREMDGVSMLIRLGSLDSFPKLLREGLAIRDAWRAVFEIEPVKAVLCGDDSNPYTHIPLLLGKKRGIPTLACHHGVFDSRHSFKTNHADAILAKGKMEEDYLVQVCGVAANSVEIGAPAIPIPVRDRRTQASEQHPLIVFFSEGYEVSCGRAEEFYRDLLPPLAELAASTSRRLVIKLHPTESRAERTRMVSRVLSRTQQGVATVVSGPLSDDLLQQAWFGVTVLSSVALECAMRRIPCFLAGWLEYWPHGYIRQFSRFGVARVLKSAAEIAEIPRMMEEDDPVPDTRNLWQPISPDRLHTLLSGKSQPERAVAV